MNTSYDYFTDEGRELVSKPDRFWKPELIRPHTMDELPIRGVGHLVLDPVCGSGTTAAVAMKTQRRFIVIDREDFAIETTRKRIQKFIDEHGSTRQWIRHLNRMSVVKCYDMSDLPYQEYGKGACLENKFWTLGDSFIIKGDSIAVLRTIPDGAADLIYADPPFNTGKDWKNKDNMGYSDIWEWDDAADARLEEIRNADIEAVNRRFKAAVEPAPKSKKRRKKKRPKPKAKRTNPFGENGMKTKNDRLVSVIEKTYSEGEYDLASYLTWTILLTLECHRILGGTTWEERPLWQPG